MWVSPVSVYGNIVPEKFRGVVGKLGYVDVGAIVENIMEKDYSGEIDCRGATFLNKCHVVKLGVENSVMDSYEGDKAFMKILRSAK